MHTNYNIDLFICINYGLNCKKKKKKKKNNVMDGCDCKQCAPI